MMENSQGYLFIVFITEYIMMKQKKDHKVEEKDFKSSVSVKTKTNNKEI